MNSEQEELLMEYASIDAMQSVGRGVAAERLGILARELQLMSIHDANSFHRMRSMWPLAARSFLDEYFYAQNVRAVDGGEDAVLRVAKAAAYLVYQYNPESSHDYVWLTQVILAVRPEILDGRVWLESSREVVRDWMRSPNRWLVLAALFVLGDLDMSVGLDVDVRSMLEDYLSTGGDAECLELARGTLREWLAP